MIEERPKTGRKMLQEIGNGHFARKDKRDRSCKETDEDQQAAENLKKTREPDQREGRHRTARHSCRKAPELLAAVLHKEARGHDAQQAEASTFPDERGSIAIHHGLNICVAEQGLF